MSHKTSGACPCRPITGTRPRSWKPGVRDVLLRAMWQHCWASPRCPTCFWYGDRVCDGRIREIQAALSNSLGVENRFHVDVEGFQIAAHLGQAAYRLDDTVYLVRRDFMHFDSKFQIVLRRFRVVFGGLWFLAPHSPSQHPKKVDQRTAAANGACIMRAVADGFTISTEHGIEQGNCAQTSVGMGSSVHI